MHCALFSFGYMRYSADEKIFRMLIDLEDRPSITLTPNFLSILGVTPFESARTIAHILNVDHTTVLSRLHKKLGMKPYCLRWVPHLLTDELRAKRKEISTLVIPYLEATKHDGWRHIVTGDESWFFFTSGPRHTGRSRKMK
jgi:hypothetical protein